MRLGEFTEKVFTYCYATHGSVTSWLRTPERNKEVGGVPTSLHQLGLAADVGWLENEDPPESNIRVTLGRRLGLKVIVEEDHDHLQPLQLP